MKKLLIAAAIVCAAAISQAASIQWATPVLYTGDAEGNFTSTTLKSATGISGFAVALTFFESDGEGGWTAIGDKDISNTSSGTIAKNGTVKATTGIYDFVLNTDYQYSAHYEYTAANGDIYTMDVGPTKFTQDAGTGNYSLAVPTASKWTVQSVPEPTSGLLLLLGVAGLALKRRRA